MLKKIDHINIVVEDLHAAKKFFIDLEFKLTNEGPLTGVWIDKITSLKNVKSEYCALRLGNNETSLELISYDTPVAKQLKKKQLPNQYGFRHLAFEVADIEKIVAQLKKKNVSFFSEIQAYEPSKKKLCYFYGPEGIILELAEYAR